MSTARSACRSALGRSVLAEGQRCEERSSTAPIIALDGTERPCMDALTRDPAQTDAPSRLRRWGMVALCLLVVAGIVYAIWFFPAATPPANKPQQRCRASRSPW